MEDIEEKERQEKERQKQLQKKKGYFSNLVWFKKDRSVEKEDDESTVIVSTPLSLDAIRTSLQHIHSIQRTRSRMYSQQHELHIHSQSFSNHKDYCNHIYVFFYCIIILFAQNYTLFNRVEME